MHQREIAKLRTPSFRRCPECGSVELITDEAYGEVSCGSCGLVLSDEMLDQSPEWRAFTPEERETKIRVGAPSSLKKFDRGLSTTFQPYTDSTGKALPTKQRLQMTRLRKWHIRATKYSSTERNLSQAMNVLRQIADKLHIPNDVAEDAALIYRKALKKGLVRGRSIEGIAAAALYAACRLTRTQRSLKDVVKVSAKSHKEIARSYRLIIRELGLKMPVDGPFHYVSKIASKARLSQQTENRAIELLQQAKQRKAVVGKGPMGIAAAALYIANIMNSEETRVTQKTLAEAADVTEVTVRNRYKGLVKSLELEDLFALSTR